MDALLFIYVALAVVIGMVASSKGRSGFGWFILGLLFSVLALIAVALMPALSGSGPNKTCPNCAETVKAAAKVCRYCQHTFDMTDYDRAVVREQRVVDGRTKAFLIFPALILGIAGAFWLFEFITDTVR